MTRTKRKHFNRMAAALILIVAAAITLGWGSAQEDASKTIVDLWERTPIWVYFLLIFAGWCPWLIKWMKRFWIAQGVSSSNKVGGRTLSQIRNALMYFTGAELSGQPIPEETVPVDGE